MKINIDFNVDTKKNIPVSSFVDGFYKISCQNDLSMNVSKNIVEQIVSALVALE